MTAAAPFFVLAFFAPDPGPVAREVAAIVAQAGQNPDPLTVRRLHDLGRPGLAALLDRALPEPDELPGLGRLTLLVLAGLIEALGDDRFDVREAATRRLIKIGPPARPLVEQAAQSPEPEIRFRAERILEATGPAPAAPPLPVPLLKAYLQTLRDPELRAALADRVAVEFAARPAVPGGDRRKVLELEVATVGYPWDARLTAKLRPLLEHANPEVGRFVYSAARKSTRHGDWSLPPLTLPALDSRHERLVIDAIYTCTTYGDPKDPAVRKKLEELFRTGSEAVKFHAALPLTRVHRDPAALEHLLRYCYGKDEQRAATAREWLRQFGTGIRGPALRMLRDAAEKHPDPEVREAARDVLYTVK